MIEIEMIAQRFPIYISVVMFVKGLTINVLSPIKYSLERCYHDYFEVRSSQSSHVCEFQVFDIN